MGFSPGEFKNVYKNGEEFHWELGGGTIKLWTATESNLIFALDLEQAIKARDQLDLLTEMLGQKCE